MNPEMLLCLNDFSIHINDKTIVENFNLTIKPGQGYLIRSHAETEKNNLLKAMAGLLPEEDCKGQVLFKGTDIYKASEKEIKEIRKHVAFLFCDGTMIANLTIRENLLLPIQFHDPNYNKDEVGKKIQEGLQHFCIPDVLNQRPVDVSYSIKKKLTFVRAHLQQPQLLLINKPMFNLDEGDRLQIFPYLLALKEKGTTLVMVSQFASLLEPLIDHIITLDEV
jgi:ABC-type ATPase involved in cell division